MVKKQPPVRIPAACLSLERGMLPLRRSIRFRILSGSLGCALALACLLPAAHARSSADTASSSEPPVGAVPLGEAVEALIPDYSQLSHHQLTKIGARWDELDELERRGLLQEVKLRMARQKGKE